MDKKEKYFSESLIREKPKQRLALQIAPNAVTTDKIAPNAVTPDKIHPDVIKIWDDIAKGAEMGGVALLNELGNSIYFGISQKTLTAVINEIWYKLEDITGETLLGIDLTVTPEYYIGESGCTVNVVAKTVSEHGILEEVKILVNGEEVARGEDVHELECNIRITDTSEIKCVAKILGIKYDRTVTITHYSPLWIGAGTVYSDVMTMDNIRSAANGMRGNYDITFIEGQKLFIVVENVIRDKFIRADMNGVEIQFTETTQTISGKTYKVLVSENAYQEGTYNIDINS